MAQGGRRWTAARVVALLAAVLVAPACTAAGSEGATDDAEPVERLTTSTTPATSTTTTTTTTTTSTTTTSTTTSPPVAALPAGDDVVVASITDGDTLRVRTAAGANEPVRLIGIDTPETRDPRRGVECFGREATTQIAALLPIGTAVRLEYDVERRDRYDRVLAYVWRAADALHVNDAMVATGYASPYRVPPNVKYAERFTQLGVAAREQGLGLWSACGGTDAPAAASAPAPASAPAAPAPVPFAAPAGDCDVNYAGACVPVSAVDLDCADVGARRFQVVGADPHGFDGDGDGVACE